MEGRRDQNSPTSALVISFIRYASNHYNDILVDYFIDYKMSHATGITTLGSTSLDNTLGAMLIGALFSMT